MSVTHIETEEEHKIDEGEREVERTLGGVENELDHHGEDLKEHEEHITNVKEDLSWVKSEITRLEAMILAIPHAPVSLIESLGRDLETLTARVDEITKKEIVEPLTEIPEVKEPEKVTRSLLDRIL